MSYVVQNLSVVIQAPCLNSAIIRASKATLKEHREVSPQLLEREPDSSLDEVSKDKKKKFLQITIYISWMEQQYRFGALHIINLFITNKELIFLKTFCPFRVSLKVKDCFLAVCLD